MRAWFWPIRFRKDMMTGKLELILTFLFFFKNKVNKLVGKLGNEYVEILGENEDYWSELL